MPFKLPPMNSLRLFEAAGRLGSFKSAADELHLTPSAVSHGIQTLEEWLGTPLFLRGARGLTLTEAGVSYLAVVRDVLARLDAATRTTQGGDPKETVRLSVTPTFASRWLVPRLDRFFAECPGIELDLDTSLQHLDLTGDGIDLAVRMSAGPLPGVKSIRLIRESFVPVCAPALLARLGDGDALSRLEKVPLLQVTTVSERWDTWFELAGVTPTPSIRYLNFDTNLLAMEAAINGVGIGLGRRPLVDGDLKVGRLIEIGAPTVRGRTGFWLMGSERAFRRAPVKAFRRWVLSEFERDSAQIDGR